ncbi:MAG: glycosyltransferase family 4 protein [Acidobacteriota bacterium]
MLAIISTHPIQYQVPLWQALALDGRVPFEVWYLTDHGTRISQDREFGRAFAWDIDTLSGYPHKFLDVAAAASPGSFLKCRLRESLRRRLRSSGTEALWVQGWQVAAYWQAVWEARAIGAEVWLRGESNDLAPKALWKHGLKKLVLREFFQRVDRFLYIGAANRRLYQRYGVSDDNLYHAPYAVDNERFARQADVLRGKRAEIRERWQIREDAFCVLFCGKFISKKRPLDLVKAARLLIATERLPNIHLLFVGSGELAKDIRDACQVVVDAEAAGAETGNRGSALPKASFAGFLNQTTISWAYVAADCLVLPSDHGETWGLVVNEAMASGLPCIVSSACGCVEDLPRAAERSACYRFGDPEALATALVAVNARRPATNDLSDFCRRNSIASTVQTVYACYKARQ